MELFEEWEASQDQRDHGSRFDFEVDVSVGDEDQVWEEGKKGHSGFRIFHSGTENYDWSTMDW